MDIGSKITPTKKMFARYIGPSTSQVRLPSSLFTKESNPGIQSLEGINKRVYGNIPVVKIADIPPKILQSIDHVTSEEKLPSFLDPKWNEIIDDSKPEIRKVEIQDNQPTFWFENPATLLQTFDVLPRPEMNDAERLNAMTRVIIIISAIMFLIKFQLWWLFLTLGLLVVVALWQLVKGRENLYLKSIHRRREYLRRPRSIIKSVNPVIHPIAPNKFSELPLNIVTRLQ